MRNSGMRGWRGVALIAAIYIYFLIFAQFAFLARMAALGIVGKNLNLVMAAMAAAGILLSLMVPRVRFASCPALRLRTGLAICAAAALLSIAPLNVATAAAAAALIGAGLGIATVTLVTYLDVWTGPARGIVNAGIGSGIAYAVCNVPAVFTAGPQWQALLAAALCVAAIILPLGGYEGSACEAPARTARIPFVVALLSFAALIWLDSAAFYIIQHTQTLKAGTWLGSVHLWANAGMHFTAAIVAGLLLQRGRTSATIALAFGALGFACVLLRDPALILSASLLYPVGVSLYSVALVAYPAFLSAAQSREERGRQAGMIYAVSGWIGSALGIGMGQNLGRVPLEFVVVAGAVVLVPLVFRVGKARAREAGVLGGGALAALLIFRLVPAQSAAELTAAERGRQVYISEGCISCHSQYVRPDSPDVLMWGPVESMAEIRAQHPPLIGNRRQGPDLAEVGMRRSPLWLKAHLEHPAVLSYRSPMPSFAFLFQDRRGDDLVAYLSALHGANTARQLAREAGWSPASSAWKAATPEDGERAYRQHCATCHGPKGAARNEWKHDWLKTPPDLDALQAFARTHADDEVAEISKFGMPGTDMPGHEYLSDAQIASIAAWLKHAPRTAHYQFTGDSDETHQ